MPTTSSGPSRTLSFYFKPKSSSSSSSSSREKRVADSTREGDDDKNDNDNAMEEEKAAPQDLEKTTTATTTTTTRTKKTKTSATEDVASVDTKSTASPAEEKSSSALSTPKVPPSSSTSSSASALLSSVFTRSSRNSRSAAMLYRVAQYRIPGTLASLVLSQGSVTDFFYPPNPSKSAIVNAANEVGLGGGGVDGAVSKAGGEALLQDRKELPIVESFVDRFVAEGKLYQEVVYVRIPTGQAKVTGPNNYGTLGVPLVIHAVGPIYPSFRSSEYPEADGLLQSAYRESIRLACQSRVEGLAFSLLSAGVFRGRRSLKEVLGLGMDAICRAVVRLHEKDKCSLREVHLCGFTSQEIKLLQVVAKERELEPLPMEEEEEGEEEKAREEKGGKEDAKKPPTEIPNDDDGGEESDSKKPSSSLKDDTAATVSDKDAATMTDKPEPMEEEVATKGEQKEKESLPKIEAHDSKVEVEAKPGSLEAETTK